MAEGTIGGEGQDDATSADSFPILVSDQQHQEKSHSNLASRSLFLGLLAGMPREACVNLTVGLWECSACVSAL